MRVPEETAANRVPSETKPKDPKPSANARAVGLDPNSRSKNSMKTATTSSDTR